MTLRRFLTLAAAALFLAATAGTIVTAESGVKIAGAAAEKPQAEKPKAKKKAAAKGKKKAAPPESRYRSRELSEGMEHSYRFDSRGNPLGGKKEAQSKAKKKSSTPPEEKREEKPGACTSEAPCPERGSDADAL